MNIARYVIALLLIVGLPPGLLLWLVVHPTARFWRRIGVGWTYTILGVPVLAMMAATVAARRWLLATDFGTNYLLVAIAFLAVVGATVISIRRRKHLTFSILAGVPELSKAKYPGKLLTEGIYASIRHPRYIEALLAVLAYALFANYAATYVLLLLTIPTLYIIVLLEEQELRQRFEAEYTDYCRNVPRFIPRRR